MRRILLLMCATAISWGSYAQDFTVSGKVTSVDDGSALPGVNVLVKGTTNGTTTDADGKYSLSVREAGDVLVFSFIGFKTQEIEIGGRTAIDVSLTTDATELTEVVVSATGVERNAKEIVYANQTVKGEDLLSTPNKNTLEALRGKTAGVRLSTGSGSVGASTRIVLRGEGSLTGNNNALIVVDGMPINNETTSGGSGVSTSGYADHGNRFNDINPDDIESVTILKGPSATSLYGSRGASGVVMITTKKGGKKMEVGLTSSYSQEKAYVILERQNKFGQGYGGATLDSGENFSWGPALDGIVRPWTSPVDTDGDLDHEWLSRPYSNVPDQLQDFFNIGNTLNNAVHISGSSGAGFTYYASYSNTDQKGILDNTRYKRNTVTLNATAKLSDKLRSDFKLTYANVNQNTAQEGSRPFEGNNAYASVVQSPINIPISELRDYKNPYHGIDGYWGSYNSTNPYYILNEYGNQARINNFLGNSSVTYDVIKGLSVTGKFGANVINTTVDTWAPKYTPEEQIVWSNDLALSTRNTRYASLGEYVNYFKTNIVLDYQFLANYTTKLTDDFSLDFSGGYNWFQTERETLEGATFGGLVVEGIYNLSNSVQSAQSVQSRAKYRLYGVLGNARIGYKNAAFLELSARNDWSSTLPKENNSFLYGALGASVVLTELFPIENNVLSFAKIRTSYGTTGKDAGLYLLTTEYAGNPDIVGLGDFTLSLPWLGQPGFTTGNRIGNPTLEPELTKTFEIGADLGFFNERVSVAYTYYNSVHSNQIINVSLPASSGFNTTSQNIGEMTNKGHELTLTVKPIEGLVQGLKLEIFGTYSKNVNEVTKVTDEIDELIVGSFSTSANSPALTLVAKEGMPFGTYRGLGQRKNSQGQTVVSGSTGFPLETVEEVYFGSFQPDYMASLGMTANYKGIGFNILFDVKQGGQFISQTKDMTEFNGTSLTSIVNDRQPFIFPNSVVDNGDDTFSPNTREIDAEGLYTVYGNPTSTTLIDASYVKLREIGLSYSFPKSLLSKTPFKTARFSLYAKNVKFWLPSENVYADPEVNGPALTGNAQGIETTQTPPSKSFGASLSLIF